MRSTPDNITALGPNEIFVFGSNTEGHHGGGAARIAVDKFGAIYGQARGLQGRSYAIVTTDINSMRYPLSSIETEVHQFFDFAKSRSDLTFFVTLIGCGIAGFTPDQIGPFFKGAPDNVILPKEFQVT